MNILIIGGAGFIGANLVRRCLQDSRNKITVLDSLDPHLKSTTDHLREVWDCIQFVRGSMNDETTISKVVQKQDIIFNCAAQTSHILSIRNPLLDTEINCLGNIRVLEAIRLLNKKAIIIFTSSSTITGKTTNKLIDETHRENPLDIYSANKGVAEKYYRIYNRVHGLKTIVLRFANIFGPYGKNYPEFGFVNYFIHLARSDKEIKIFGSGNQTRNVMYVEDATEILYLAAQNEQLIGETCFATHDEHHSIKEIALKIVTTFGKGKITHIEWPEERRNIEIDQVNISSDKLYKITGWKPKYTLEEGLIRTKEIIIKDT